MKFKHYIIDKKVLEGFIILNQYNLNEMSDSNFDLLKSFGDKIGLRINKSNTIFSILSKFSKNITKVLVLTTKYQNASISDDNQRANELRNEISGLLRQGSMRKEIISFFMQLDNATFSLLTIPRNILQSVFGLEITSYNDWLSDKDYILTSLNKIKKVLMNIPDNSKEMNMLNSLYISIEGK